MAAKHEEKRVAGLRRCQHYQRTGTHRGSTDKSAPPLPKHQPPANRQRDLPPMSSRNFTPATAVVYGSVIHVAVLRGLKAWLQYFNHVFWPDSWLLLDIKIQVKPESLLCISAPPIYLFLDHTQTTHPASA